MLLPLAIILYSAVICTEPLLHMHADTYAYHAHLHDHIIILYVMIKLIFSSMHFQLRIYEYTYMHTYMLDLE